MQCPDEIVPGLHMDFEQRADVIKKDAAIRLFRDGNLLPGIAAYWLGIPLKFFFSKP